MSRTVDLFLDSDQPLDQLAGRLGELTGREFAPFPGTQTYVVRAEVIAYLAEHDFLDDEGLPLSEFRYVLTAVVRGPEEVESSPEAGFLRTVNALLKQEGCLASLLVLDLDRPDPHQVAREHRAFAAPGRAGHRTTAGAT